MKKRNHTLMKINHKVSEKSNGNIVTRMGREGRSLHIRAPQTSDSRYGAGDLSGAECSDIAGSDRRRPWKS